MYLREVFSQREKLLQENGFVSYSEYLQSEEWKELKAKIRKRKGAKWNFCNICGGDKNLNIHHSSYRVIGIKHPGNTIKILCQPCHNQLHGLCKTQPTLDFYDAFRAVKKIRQERGLPIFRPN